MTLGQIWLPIISNVENFYIVIYWEDLAANYQIERIFMFLKKAMTTEVCLSLP